MTAKRRVARRRNPPATIAGVTADMVEGMIDRTSVGVVLEMIQIICEEKAQHIEVEWQDARTAKPWNDAAAKIGAVVRKISV